MATEKEVKVVEAVLRRWAATYGVAALISEDKYESVAVDILLAVETIQQENDK